MTKSVKLFLLAVLTAAALVTAAPRASATPNYCTACAQTGDCYACCNCDGGSPTYCRMICLP